MSWSSVTLELGGKNPVVVAPGADIDKAAARIAAARMVNGGQVCVCPDYVFVPEDGATAFIDGVRRTFASMFPSIVDNPDYCSCVNEPNFDRVLGLLDDAHARGALVEPVAPAGELLPDRASRKIAPTIVGGIDDGMRIATEEIFGPVLVVMTYPRLSDAIDYINARPAPLVAYWYGADNADFRSFVRNTRSGGVARNDFAAQMIPSAAPFGGVGRSGMGAYHGKAGFDAFSHHRSVVGSDLPFSITRSAAPVDAGSETMTMATVLFDPFSEEFFNSPYETYRRMREEAPVYYSEQYDFYALTRHEDVAAAFKDYETYSSAYGVDLGQVRKNEVTEHGSIIAMDPPAHRRMRSLLNKVFTPRAIQEHRGLVSETIEKHLSAVDPTGFDFVQDFSALFPVDVMTTMQGVPDEDHQQIRLWIDHFLSREAGEVDMSEAGLKSAIDMAIYYYRLIKERRKNPGDDLLSKLIDAEIERDNGAMEPLNNVEITEFAQLLGGAGAETVTKLLGSAAVVFARNPDQWQKLHDDRSKIGSAVEELLRYEAPAQYNVRRSMREIDLHGVTIPVGKPVFLVGGSANRDPDAWTDPDRFDIDRDRTEAQNLGLGYGIHSCLGAALARMESAIALDKMLDFMPRYEVDWAGCKRVNMQNVAGWSSVPVRVLQ